MQASHQENESVAGSSIPTQIGGNNTSNTSSSGTQMPQHGPHARGVAQISTTRTQRSQVQYDHNGNIIS